MSTEIHFAGLSSSVPGRARPDDGIRSRPAHGGRPSRQGYAAGRCADPAADHGDAGAEAPAGRCRGKAPADPRLPRCDRPRRRGAGDGRLGRLVHLGRRPGPGSRLRAGLDPAVHQPDLPRGDHRQRAELPRVRGRAGGPGIPAQGAALVRRPVPGRRGAVPQQAGGDRHGRHGCSQVRREADAPACPAAPADRAGAAAAPRAGPDADPGRRGDLPQLRPRRARGRRGRPPGPPADPRGGRPGRPPGRQRRPPGPVPPADLQGLADPASGRRSPSPAAGMGSVPR